MDGLLVLGLAGGGEQLGGSPIEFVLQVGVIVGTGSHKVVIGIDVRMMVGRLPGSLGCLQAALCEGRIQIFPYAGRLGGGGSQIQGRSRAGMAQETGLWILVGRERHPGPGFIGDLVEDHA
ncbi:hypothetical protein D3C84_697770 [compost metagenome]